MKLTQAFVPAVLASFMAVLNPLAAYADFVPKRVPAEARPAPLGDIVRQIQAGASFEIRLLEDDVRVAIPSKQMAAKTDVETFLAEMRKIVGTRVIKTGDVTYRLEWNRLTSDNRTLFDIGDRYRAAIEDSFAGTEDIPTGQYTTDFGSKLIPLSLNGELVTYVEASHSYESNMAHSDAYTEFHAVRADSGAPASLLHYVTEDSLVAALKADKWILRNLSKGRRATLATLKTWREVDRLLAAGLQTCEFAWLANGEMKSSFAVYDYEMATGKVIVRLGIPHGCEAARGTQTQISLKLDPKPVFQKQLMDDKNQGTGLFMRATGWSQGR